MVKSLSPVSKKRMASRSPMPFSGLGLDLTPVATRAESIRLEEICLNHQIVFPWVAENRADRHGFALMTFLGRETRGR